MNVRDTGIEETVESLDESVDFQFELIGTNDCAMNGGVERRSVSTCSKDADAFHLCTLRAMAGDFQHNIKIPRFSAIAHVFSIPPAEYLVYLPQH